MSRHRADTLLSKMKPKKNEKDEGKLYSNYENNAKEFNGTKYGRKFILLNTIFTC